jgi:hypothetical protein
MRQASSHDLFKTLLRRYATAETTNLGVIPDMSQIRLHADAALNATADAGLKPADVDGTAIAGETPVTITHYLGITPKWVDGARSAAARS